MLVKLAEEELAIASRELDVRFVRRVELVAGQFRRELREHRRRAVHLMARGRFR